MGASKRRWTQAEDAVLWGTSYLSPPEQVDRLPGRTAKAIEYRWDTVAAVPEIDTVPATLARAPPSYPHPRRVRASSCHGS